MQASSDRDGRGGGFTLIEMMVVIVIIFILAGIVLKLLGIVGLKTAESRCQYELQQLRNALEEFYAEYGHFPPVNTVRYEHECADTNYQTPWFRDTFLPAHNNPADPANYFPDTREGRVPGSLGWSTNFAPHSLNYHYGLVSYLYRRDRGNQPHWFDDDTDRDRGAKDRWNHFISDFVDGHDSGAYHIQLQNLVLFTNKVATLHDPWGQTYEYRCPPPHLRFKLWSKGPDQQDGTADDILMSNE